MIELTLSASQAAPLLLEQKAKKLRDRGHSQRSQYDCWTLLDAYLTDALDDAAADSGLGLGHPRSGRALALGAAVYTRKLSRIGVERIGDLQSTRMRLRHFGCPSTWHLRLVAEQAGLLAATLQVSIDEPFAASRLDDLHSVSTAGELLKLAGAASAGTTSAGDLAAGLGRALFVPAWTDVIAGGRAGAKKARAYARQKARAALASGQPVKLASSSLTPAGNALLTEVLNTGIEVWACHGIPFSDQLSEGEVVATLGGLAEERCRPQIATLLIERARIQGRRSRLSPLAARQLAA